MVVMSGLSSIFWGVTLEGSQGGKKKYTQKTERPVHISMAALDPSHEHGDGPVSLMIEQDGKSFVLCNLKYGSLFQQPLDLEFACGEEITFYVNGKGVVHLSGYLMPEADDFADYEPDSGSESEEASDDESEEEDEAVMKPGKKRMQAPPDGNRNKKAKLTIDDIGSDEDSDDDDFIDDEAEEASDNGDDKDGSDEDDDDSEDESSEEEPVSAKKKGSGKLETPNGAETKQKSKDKPTPSKIAVVDKTPTAKTKQPTGTPKQVAAAATPKQQQQQQKTADTPKQKQNSQQSTDKPQTPATLQGAGDASNESGKKKKKNKKKKNKQENQLQLQQGESSSTPTTEKSQAAKRTVEGGVVIEDVKDGHGPEAKMGKMVRVYYTGRLPNGKIFDSSLSGNGFKFKLGKKEVISGWDVGLSGMKVGGKRRLIIPPKMGYGTQSAGAIPPNSTLIFDVELKAVN